ncbi:sialin-like isoform X1 [Biomphalaria pfeifferi]|uniref:Sialin-like isoform X1 n=1 Tax=Biomphalaria pfeifferi TaxID=112525 RepID=A0AAD8BLF3_BIOPF|nr:sialin-like isoform X1 [Biomphalaria pfeifferi]
MCLGTAVVYAVRINLSVAILCMVRKAPAVTITNDNNTDWEHPKGDTYCDRILAYKDATEKQFKGEFDWDKGTIAQLLAMFFYGYLLTQLLSGWLASRFGGTKVWGWNMFISGLCTVLTPLLARSHISLLYFVRVVIGFCSGVALPCVYSILGHWAPPSESSKLTSLSFAGLAVGSIATLSTSGLLCHYGFDNGWGSIFYISGLVTLLWSGLWLTMTTDLPSENYRITTLERVYIETSIGRGGMKKLDRVPWKDILTSRAVWALTISHFCNNYIYYTMITLVPTYLDESFNFNIQENGMLSSLLYLFEFFTSLCVGYAADNITHNKILTLLMVRKLFQLVSLIGTAFGLLLVAQITTCENRYWAVFLLCLSSGFMTFNRAGILVNHLDLAPGYAGILFGLTNTFGTVPGMIAPVIAGYLTPNKTTEEWRNVFYLCALDAVAGALVFTFFGEVELQPWAMGPEKKAKKNAQQDTELSTTTTSQLQEVMDIPPPTKLSSEDGSV